MIVLLYNIHIFIINFFPIKTTIRLMLHITRHAFFISRLSFMYTLFVYYIVSHFAAVVKKIPLFSFISVNLSYLATIFSNIIFHWVLCFVLLKLIFLNVFFFIFFNVLDCYILQRLVFHNLKCFILLYSSTFRFFIFFQRFICDIFYV